MIDHFTGIEASTPDGVNRRVLENAVRLGIDDSYITSPTVRSDGEFDGNEALHATIRSVVWIHDGER